MSKKALFPGSFDPFTKGHEFIIAQCLDLFDEITIGIGVNTDKKYQFNLEKRIAHIEHLYSGNKKVSIDSYQGLTVDFCNKISASHILRGLRNSIDFEYEKSIAQMNRAMSGIETVFIMTEEHLSPINSSIVRDIHKNNGDITPFVTHSEKLI